MPTIKPMTAVMDSARREIAVRYQPEMASLTPPMNATPGSSRMMTDVTVSDASVWGWNTATVAGTATATTPAVSCAKNSGQPMRVRAECAHARAMLTTKALMVTTGSAPKTTAHDAPAAPDAA